MGKNKQKTNPGALLKLEGLPVATMNTVSLAGEIDKRVRRVFKLCESESAIVRTAANEAVREYVESQRAIFASKGMNPDRALKDAIVGYEESGRMRWRIVPRGETLEEIDTGNENGDHALSIAGAKSYSSRMGLAKEQSRGKYNDGHFLISQSSCSVDASEVVPFAIP